MSDPRPSFSISRRAFLGGTGASTAALVAGGPSLPLFLARAAHATPAGSGDDRVLVIVQLTGGNDGLNTVIPYADDRYHRARPTLRVAPSDVVRLDDRLGLHPSMRAFESLWDDGALGVVTDVGYPNPDRSHFRSMDVWQTATLDPGDRPTGWIGRLADARSEDAHGRAPLALHVDDAELPLALRGRRAHAPSIPAIDALRVPGDAEDLRRIVAADTGSTSDDAAFLQRVAVSACAQAGTLAELAIEGDDGVDWPGSPLARRLRQIAQLIQSGFGARVYYTSLGGFDTHARQALSHPALLRTLAEGVTAFQRSIEARGCADRVALMTFSEFGRRVDENGSRGTDHGAAAPLFVVGSHVRAGIHGGPPDLEGLERGDLPHRVDFRRVYGTMLDRWLGLDPRATLGDAPATLPLVLR